MRGVMLRGVRNFFKLKSLLERKCTMALWHTHIRHGKFITNILSEACVDNSDAVKRMVADGDYLDRARGGED